MSTHEKCIGLHKNLKRMGITCIHCHQPAGKQNCCCCYNYDDDELIAIWKVQAFIKYIYRKICIEIVLSIKSWDEIQLTLKCQSCQNSCLHTASVEYLNTHKHANVHLLTSFSYQHHWILNKMQITAFMIITIITKYSIS